MKYHGKLYGKLWNKYFEVSHTDETDEMEKKVAELEAELEALRKHEVMGCCNCTDLDEIHVNIPAKSTRKGRIVFDDNNP